MRFNIILVLLLSTFILGCKTDGRSLAADKTSGNSPEVKAKITNPKLNELSGIAASKKNKDVFWVHNDSGDKAQIFAISENGQLICTVQMPAIDAQDWEDICLGPGPQKDSTYIYIGDIGDNLAKRDIKTIYRLLEPDLSKVKKGAVLIEMEVEAIRFRFPDGSRDAETLMSDPLNGDLYIASKRENKVGVYRLPFPQSTKEVLTAEFQLKLPVTQVTAGDISPDGRHILLKNYEQIFYWSRDEGQSIREALKSFPRFLNYMTEPQGEAICFSPDLSGYYTISEMADKGYTILYFYPYSFTE